jgi:hypothetical protein
MMAKSFFAVAGVREFLDDIHDEIVMFIFNQEGGSQSDGVFTAASDKYSVVSGIFDKLISGLSRREIESKEVASASDIREDISIRGFDFFTEEFFEIFTSLFGFIKEIFFFDNVEDFRKVIQSEEVKAAFSTEVRSEIFRNSVLVEEESGDLEFLGESDSIRGRFEVP